MRPTNAALALSLLLAACASAGPPPGTRVVDLDRMEEVAANVDAPFVIRIPAGTRLPVDVRVETPFLHSEGGTPAFHAVFDRTVWWFPGTPERISFDGTTWQPLDAGGEGLLSVGLGRSAEQGSRAHVLVGLRPRDGE